MSLFGSSPPGNEPSLGRDDGGGMFDDPPSKKAAGGSSLFADEGDNEGDSPWAMPTPRKKKSRADVIRDLLPASDVPESYIETFDTVVRNDSAQGGRAVSSDGLAKLFAAARLSEPTTQARIVSLVTPEGSSSDDIALGRSEFNVLLALVGLAQEGEVISLDGVDERRRSKSNTCYDFLLPFFGMIVSFVL
jgi:sorting nexin-8